MARKDWKKTGENEWTKGDNRIEVSRNQNRPEGGKNSYQTFLFVTTHSGNFEDVGLLTKDKLVSKTQAISLARKYMRSH